MSGALLTLTFAVAITAPPGKSETPRPPNPIASSLPLLTDAEEEELDRIIDRFIQYDTGKLPGDEGKKALREFQKLGPEATFALMRGLNKSANIEASCPVVTISKKLSGILRSTRDRALLQFARENIGAGVTAQRHKGVLNDLKVSCMVRDRSLSAGGREVVAPPVRLPDPPPILEKPKTP